MDITATSAVAQTQAKTQNDAAVAGLKRAVAANAQQGAELARLVDQAGGVGKQLDVYA
jgi:hypothetical protein